MKKPVKILIAVLIALVLGTAIGVGSVILSYNSAVATQNIKNGSWQTNLGTGTEKANPYLRAATAVHYLLALNQSETIYYSANTDDSGNLLNANNDYRMEGKAPDARWWSITVYGADDFLIPNALNRYSYNANNVSLDSNGKFSIYVSKQQQAGAWLPLGDQKRFVLALRLYNPGQSVRTNPATIELPHIIKVVKK